jgi:hypothetical protein
MQMNVSEVFTRFSSQEPVLDIWKGYDGRTGPSACIVRASKVASGKALTAINATIVIAVIVFWLGQFLKIQSCPFLSVFWLSV